MESEQNEVALRLEGFQVRMFRSILNSGFIPVYPLTALVGRQESGKTSLLSALQGLDRNLKEPYARERDWPRHAHWPPRAKQVVCSAVFRLGEQAREALVGDGAIESGTRGVRLSRAYTGSTVVEVWNGERVDGGSIDEEPSPPVRPALNAFVRKHLPAILFAGPDSLLPKAVTFHDLEAASTTRDDSGVGALARLLSAVGHAPADLVGDHTPRAVQEAGDRIQELLADRATPHRLALNLRRGRIELFLRVGRGGRVSMDKLALADRYRLTLDLRLAACGESGGTPPILLLDAPGRSFRGHLRAQMARMLDTYVSAGVTVLYTARLPFDIDLQHPEQVLVLSRASDGSAVACPGKEAVQDLAVRAALGMTGRPSFRIDDINLVVEGASDVWIIGALDELLRRSGEAALPHGMNLTSAGGSYEVAAIVAFLGRQGLAAIGLVDSDTAGVRADLELERLALADRRIKRVEILQLSTAAELDRKDATIEDLFPIRFYLDVAREVCGREAGAAIAKVQSEVEAYEQGTGGNIARRLRRAFIDEGQRFPKARVAKALEGRIANMASVADLPPGMVQSVRNLMEAIRSATDRQCHPS